MPIFQYSTGCFAFYCACFFFFFLCMKACDFRSLLFFFISCLLFFFLFPCLLSLFFSFAVPFCLSGFCFFVALDPLPCVLFLIWSSRLASRGSTKDVVFRLGLRVFRCLALVFFFCFLLRLFWSSVLLYLLSLLYYLLFSPVLVVVGAVCSRGWSSPGLSLFRCSVLFLVVWRAVWPPCCFLCSALVCRLLLSLALHCSSIFSNGFMFFIDLEFNFFSSIAFFFGFFFWAKFLSFVLCLRCPFVCVFLPFFFCDQCFFFLLKKKKKKKKNTETKKNYKDDRSWFCLFFSFFFVSCFFLSVFGGFPVCFDFFFAVFVDFLVLDTHSVHRGRLFPCAWFSLLFSWFTWWLVVTKYNQKAKP